MSLLWIDGFEGYNASPDEGYRGGTNQAIAGAASSRGLIGQALVVSAGGTTLILPPRDTIIVGYAIKTAAIGGNAHWFLGNDANAQISWGVNGLNEFYFINHTGAGFHIVTPIFSIPRFANVWRYVEVKITPHNSNGAIVLRVDDVEHLNVSGLDTLNGIGTPNYRTVSPNASGALIDDYYVADTLGPAPWNDFLGDNRMHIIKPNGVHTTNWTPSDGVTPNWDLVNDVTTDHAGYIKSSVLGTKDLWEYEDPALPPSTIVHAIAVMTSAQRDKDSGPRAIKAHVLSGATEVEGAFHQLSDSWYMEQFLLETDPNTGLPWTIAALNAIKAGTEIEV